MRPRADPSSRQPKPKAKAKAAPKAKAPAKPKAAPKKLTQSTLTSKPSAKKRAKPESDEEDSNDDISNLSNTPPSPKKQKKTTAASKKSSGKPLEEIENESMQLDSPPAPARAGSKKTAEETYQKLSQLEHIIKRPDSYIGSVEMTESQMWTFNKETKHMELRKIHYVPGLYKIFDEILVNAADNKQRDSPDHTPMTALKVHIDRAAGQISVENNGKGIPVVLHTVSSPVPGPMPATVPVLLTSLFSAERENVCAAVDLWRASHGFQLRRL